jgi:hypothetical protein
VKKYGYTIVTVKTDGIKIKSTEVSVLEMTKNEIRRLMPKCAVESDEWINRDDKFRRLPSGGFYADGYKNLGPKNQELGWWLIKMLASNGWQPFASEKLTTLARNQPPSVVETHLRHEYE